MTEQLLKNRAWSIVLLCSVCLLLFINTLPNEFVRGDDTCLISDNRYIRSYKNIPRFFIPHYWNELHPFKARGQFRPVRTTTFAVDFFFWGLNPTGYHLTNLFLHMINTVLVYFFIAFLTGGDKNKIRTGNAGAGQNIYASLPLLAGLLFAAHPVHVESIAFVKNRSELLAALFFFMFLIFIISSNGEKTLSRPLLFLAALICYVLAAGAKESALSFEYYRTALQHNPEDENVYNSTGLLLTKQGYFEEAEDQYRIALKHAPFFVEAYYNLGVLQAITGQEEQAEQNFMAALAINPDYSLPHQALGMIRSRQGDWEAAIEHYEKALRLDDMDSKTHFGIGVVLGKQGYPDRAIKHYQRALKLNPDYVDVHYNLAMILAEQGRLDAAVDSLKNVLALKPEDSAVQEQLDNIYKKRAANK